MIYYKSKFIVRPRTEMNTDEIEAIWIEMIFPNKSRTLILSVYRPTNADINDFNAMMENLPDVVSCEEKEIIILGDFNCDLSAKQLSPDTRKLCKLLNIYQFTQTIKEPTRITEQSSTLIDLAFTIDNSKVMNSGVIHQCAISDHSLIYIVRRARTPRDKARIVNCRSYKYYDPEAFVADLHAASWEAVNNSLATDNGQSHFNDTFVNIADKHAPMGKESPYQFTSVDNRLD